MITFKSLFTKLSYVLLPIVLMTVSHAGTAVIVSSPPQPRDIVVGPPGYTTCYVVQPGFYNGVWQHKHRVCEYEKGSGLRMWVTGYWQCGSYRAGGVCTGWRWVGSHWASPRDMQLYRKSFHHGSNRRYTHTNIHGHINQHGRQHGHDAQGTQHHGHY